MKKSLYNVLYAISYAALIFVVTYVVYFGFESMRLEFLRFYIKGTEFSLASTNTIYIALDSICEGVFTPVFGSFKVIKYVAILTAIIPVCHLIEMLFDKAGAYHGLRSGLHNRYLSMIPYILIGLGTLYFLRTNMYTLVDSASKVSMCKDLFDTYTIGNALRIAVYVVTLIAIYVVSSYSQRKVWSAKASMEYSQASEWIDVRPLLFCVLSIFGILYFIFDVATTTAEVEYKYYYY